MPDPTCTINGSPTPADVSASSTVNGALATPAGARFWSVVCISTDDSTTAAIVNATLTVNQGAKTFQFTAQGAGSAYIFSSTVGILGLGLDANGTVQPSYSVTFKVNVKTAHGFRVLAEGETFEQDSTHGWVAVLNAAIRSL